MDATATGAATGAMDATATGAPTGLVVETTTGAATGEGPVGVGSVSPAEIDISAQFQNCSVTGHQ